MIRSVSILVAAVFLAVLVHHYNDKQGKMASEKFEDQEDTVSSETEDLPELNGNEDSANGNGSASGSASPSDPMEMKFIELYLEKMAVVLQMIVTLKIDYLLMIYYHLTQLTQNGLKLILQDKVTLKTKIS